MKIWNNTILPNRKNLRESNTSPANCYRSFHFPVAFMINKLKKILIILQNFITRSFSGKMYKLVLKLWFKKQTYVWCVNTDDKATFAFITATLRAARWKINRINYLVIGIRIVGGYRWLFYSEINLVFGSEF